MTWPEYARRIEAGPTVIVPVGALEQHGPHLPLGTDAILPTEIAREVASETNALVAPTIGYGYRSMPKSGGGPHFPGTTDLEAATLVNLVRDIVCEQARHGVRKLCFMVGHYENQWIVTEGIHLAMQRVGDKGVRVMRLEYWDFCTQDVLDQVFPDGFPGVALEHAAVMETSLMLHYHPDRVRLDLIPDNPSADFPPYDMFPAVKDWVPSSGALTSAKASTADKGRVMAEHYRRTIAAA
ncbi:MAG: creatininase, partial [Alphaproteobacteria bacterium]